MEFNISIDLSEVIEGVGGLSDEIDTRLHDAVDRVAQRVQAAWQEVVYRSPLWSGERDAYAESIQYRKDPDRMSATIWTDYRHAEDIESGRPARDLKRMLNTSTKVRRTTTGLRFLIIPIQHNTPGNTAHARAMPADVFRMASQLASSSITGIGQRPAGQMVKTIPGRGMIPTKKQPAFLSNPSTKSKFMVAKNSYQWGERLKASDMKGMPKDVRQRYGGMYRFDQGGSGQNRSGFLTFRTMMEGSSGWVVPPKPGLFIAKSISEHFKEVAEREFAAAIMGT